MTDTKNIKGLPYRKNVSCIVFRGDKYLLVQLADWEENWWKFPQGGMEVGEIGKDTIRRELLEELGISKFKIIAKSKYTNLYDWPKEIVIKRGLKWRGQDQIFYLVQYLGNESDIKISNPNEVKKFQWVTKAEFFDLIDQKEKIFSGYKKVIKKIFNEFRNILK